MSLALALRVKSSALALLLKSLILALAKVPGLALTLVSPILECLVIIRLHSLMQLMLHLLQ